jgi:cell division protein FtsB
MLILAIGAMFTMLGFGGSVAMLIWTNELIYIALAFGFLLALIAILLIAEKQVKQTVEQVKRKIDRGGRDE